ncbi:MAG: zinc ABC transporter substrate-binding protein [Bacteroidota bacterium]
MTRCLCVLLLAAAWLPSTAQQLRVVAAYPYIASIAEQVGGPDVRVEALAQGDWDPHTILPRPSFIARLRMADLLIINGAQLEIGWLPALMNQAGNPGINVGSRGLLDLSRFVKLMDAPSGVSRAHGDIHPDGNPHFCLDPGNVPLLARAVAERLSELHPAGAQGFASRREAFERRWGEKMKEWSGALAPLKGKTVVEYHRIFDYFLARYGMRILGTVEMLPGIPPASGHIAELENRMKETSIRFLLQDVYNPADATRHLARKHGIPLVELPHDVGAVTEATDIFGLFDEIVRRLALD